LRLHLSDLLEKSEDWVEAAKVLQGIPLGSGHRSVPNIYKLRIYVRIVRLLLEGDDAVGADTFLKRASMVIHSVPGAVSTLGPMNAEDEERLAQTSEEEKTEARTLGLQYKLCQARIYDDQRRFAEAAIRFHEVSYVTDIDEGERNMML
jgi:COP9 signalosome complex subunit 4